MADTRRPRSIRDIAHLYLSRNLSRRAEPPPPSPTLNVFVASENRDCLSAFHVANIAAAMVLRNASVRVFELSGLLPNAAFYFSHRPAVYLGGAHAVPREFSPLLNAISISFDSVRLMGQHPVEGKLRFNLIHLPTVSDPENLAEALSAMRERCPGERWVLYVTRETTDEGAKILSRGLAASDAFVLHLPEGDSSGGGEIDHLGHICRWEHAAADRVPAVVRNPNSGLAREYIALCESLLGRIDSSRRRQRVDQDNRGKTVRSAGR